VPEAFRTAATPWPDIRNRDLEPYWRGTAAGELRAQQCASCGAYRWPPRPACFACTSLDAAWVAVPSQGELYTWTVVNFTPLEGFRDLVPYAVGVVQLDEVPIRMAGYTGAAPEDLRMGDRMRAEFVDKGDGVVVPIWARISGPQEAS
jgi:uncharacterized OB-fold protein